MNAQKNRRDYGPVLRGLRKLGLIEEGIDLHFDSDSYLPIRSLAIKGYFNEADAIEQIASKFGFGSVEITKTESANIRSLLSNDLFRNVESETWIEQVAVPWKIKGNTVEVVFANPFDIEAQKNLEFKIGRKIIPLIAAEEEILTALQSTTRGADSSESFLKLVGDAVDLSTSQSGLHTHQESELHHDDASAPAVVRIVDKVISDSIELQASDIHVVPERDSLKVKIRVDGTLRPLTSIPNSAKSSVLSRIKLLSGMDIAERRKPQDGRLRIKRNGSSVDLRVSTVPSVHGETIVARILKGDRAKTSLDALQMPDSIRDQYEKLLKGSSKVILVSGPTGSGKTSTLYSGITHLADGSRNIITIEDPIEYRIDGITQIQVNQKISMTFADGLRSVLRQDPDVVMVGEIRDLETAQTAMNAAQTGHLVLSTLHTNSAPGGIVRLLDLGVQDYIIASSVSAIIAQRLVRKLCPMCARKATEEETRKLANFIKKGANVRSAVGCDDCGGTGFQGRFGLYSILEITPEIAQTIKERRSESEIVSIAKEQGFISLWDSGLIALEDGSTSYEELERVLGTYERGPIDKISAPLPTKQGQGITKRRLLLVEDDETTRSVLRMLFEDQFFEVEEATNGIEALEKIYESAPEIVICDLMMPRMNGLDMVKKLKGDVRTAEIPVIMLTAAATEENELKLIDSGADDFVSKTTDSKIMLARINRLLAQR